MTDRPFLAALVIAFLLLLLGLMYLGWRRRQRRQSGIPRPLPVPAEVGEPRLSLDAFYVATTVADDPLNRIAVGGLGFRGRAVVAVHDDPSRERGVVLGIAGEPDAWLPVRHIDRVDRSTATIDRVVERGGLVRIGWRLGDNAVDTYLRVGDAASQSALLAALARLTTTHEGE